MDQPSTPIQALQVWLAERNASDALAGVPIGALLGHFLQAQAQGSPSARHELKLLAVLVDHWLRRLQFDIGSFPPAAVAVLQEQKKALLNTHAALTELQLCLQALRGAALPGQAPPCNLAWTRRVARHTLHSTSGISAPTASSGFRPKPADFKALAT